MIQARAAEAREMIIPAETRAGTLEITMVEARVGTPGITMVEARAGILEMTIAEVERVTWEILEMEAVLEILAAETVEQEMKEAEIPAMGTEIQGVPKTEAAGQAMKEVLEMETVG